MNFVLNFPLFLIILSLVSAVVSVLLKKEAARVLTLVLAALSFSLNTVLFFYVYRSHESFTYMMGHFPHPWGNELKISTLETVISLALSLVLFLTVFGGKKQLSEMIEPEKAPYFYVMTDLIQASLLVLAYTNDLFTGYVFIEILTLSACGILLIRQLGKTTLAAARYMIFSLIGSGLFLLGVIFLYSLTGHLLMPNLKESISALYQSKEYRLPLLSGICLIMIGLAVKSGLAPFHLWMPDTYGSSVPAASGILSGLVSKGYIFFLIRIVFDVIGTDVFYVSGVHNVLFGLGAFGIIIGSIGALRESSIFRMIAYSSAAQIGYIYMGIGLSPTVGIEAALFHILTHALTKPALFLSAAHLTDAAGGAKKFRNLRGVGYADRFSGVLFTFGAFSMIGLPLTMGFISKYLFGMAAFDSTHTKMIPTLIVLAVSTILNTLYFARAVLRLYEKREGEPLPKVRLKAELPFFLSGLAFAAANLTLGIFARKYIEIIANGIPFF